MASIWKSLVILLILACGATQWGEGARHKPKGVVGAGVKDTHGEKAVNAARGQFARCGARSAFTCIGKVLVCPSYCFTDHQKSTTTTTKDDQADYSYDYYSYDYGYGGSYGGVPGGGTGGFPGGNSGNGGGFAGGNGRVGGGFPGTGGANGFPGVGGVPGNGGLGGGNGGFGGGNGGSGTRRPVGRRNGQGPCRYDCQVCRAFCTA